MFLYRVFDYKNTDETELQLNYSKFTTGKEERTITFSNDQNKA